MTTKKYSTQGFRYVLFSILILCLFSASVHAQIINDPAKWSFGVKKLTKDTYEIHLRCTLKDGWHLYSQTQSDEFIGTKTKINFKKQAGLQLLGNPIEKGKKEKYENKVMVITNYQYSGTIDFIQKVKVNTQVKQVVGFVTFQTCTEEQCLPEKTISIEIPLNK